MLTPNIPYLVEVDDTLRHMGPQRVTLKLTGAQRLFLVRVAAGCRDGGLTLASGKAVQTPLDALQYAVEASLASVP